MKKTESGQPAKYGFYVSASPVDARFVGADGEPLEGRTGARYTRVPTWLFLLLSPVIGGAFVLAFPLLVVGALLYAIWATFAAKVLGRAHLARSSWQPAMAHFKTPEGADSAEDSPSAELQDLQEEVQAMRAEERPENHEETK